MLFNSEKYPAFLSSVVGPAIKSWRAKFATPSVGDTRSTGKTASNFVSDSGNLEKYTVIGYPLTFDELDIWGGEVAAASLVGGAITFPLQATRISVGNVSAITVRIMKKG
jgi:hypothetical protein